jgi:hypothetical protein
MLCASPAEPKEPDIYYLITGPGGHHLIHIQPAYLVRQEGLHALDASASIHLLSQRGKTKTKERLETDKTGKKRGMPMRNSVVLAWLGLGWRSKSGTRRPIPGRLHVLADLAMLANHWLRIFERKSNAPSSITQGKLPNWLLLPVLDDE